MKILFIGDIVGKGGRRAVAALAPVLRRQYGCAIIVANGENMAAGAGLNAKCIRSVTPAPMVDVITGGDHMWDQKEFAQEADLFPWVLRPANLPACQPARGGGVFLATDGLPVGVVCLQGRTFINSQADCPFAAADRMIEELRPHTAIVVVDFHGEATSEKIAMGRYLDGRASVVLGTHTHVATADEQILPGGTAYQTDVGMVGGRESVLGREIKPVLHRFTTGMPARFNVVETNIRLNATLVEVCPESGRATGIERIVRDFD